MALETLKGLKEINGYKVTTVNEDMGVPIPNYLAPKTPIVIDHDANIIAFKIQNGPIKEVGKNGCQVADIMYVCLEMLSKLNKKFPCVENERAISSLADSIKHLAERKTNRESRGVEGTSQK